MAVDEGLATRRLVQAIQDLSLARSLDAIITRVRTAARELTGADGASFILRDVDCCHYVDEDAIGPLWKGQKFPMTACISGWAMLNRQPVAIEDIFLDPRIPVDAYRPTFVKSLVMVPIREAEPIGAIGTYWAHQRVASEWEVRLLQTLANSTAVAMENVRVYEELEQRVRQRTAQLEEANRELDAFSFTVSHDLRAPLRHMIGFSRLLRERASEKLDGSSLDYVQRIDGAAQRMTALVDNLLTFSRLGRAPLEKRAVDLGALVSDARVEAATDGGDRDIEWVIGDLPTVRGDRSLLYQAVLNLLSNAVKYTRGRTPARIEVGASVGADGQIVLAVSDNGAGFEPSQVGRLFGVFQRLHRDADFQGTGVGLATVRRIIARHGGRTWAEGAVGQGATFYCSLPAGGEPPTTTT